MTATGRIRRGLALLALLPLLGACAHLLEPERPYHYLCPDELRFQAWLYEDMAMLEGDRGHVVLERVQGGPAEALHYADRTVQAHFGLGHDGRLARLDYTSIPEPVYCQRQSKPEEAGGDPVRTQAEHGPRPPGPPEPMPPAQTNLRTESAPVRLGPYR